MEGEANGPAICTSKREGRQQHGKTEESTDPTETITEEATDAPTEAPSEAPNEAPTEAPTAAPTEAPSEPPTQAHTDPPETEPKGTTYVLNISSGSRKFHYPSCSSADQMSDKNKKYFEGTREEVIAMGYEPCGRCHP